MATSTKLGVMEEITARSASIQMSPLHRDVLDQILDKWSLEVLDHLCREPMRFNALRRLIPAVSQKSLSAALRKLERNGIVYRTILSTRPVGVEYSITALGKTLRDPIDVLVDWASEHIAEIEVMRARFDEE